MKYLSCIELLNLTLQQLKAEQRDLVPVSALKNVQTLLSRARDLLSVKARTLLDDVLMATEIMIKKPGLLEMSSNMRDTLVEGIRDILADTCAEAWDYYTREEVPVSEETMELLKTIVYYHYGVRGV